MLLRRTCISSPKPRTLSKDDFPRVQRVLLDLGFNLEGQELVIHPTTASLRRAVLENLQSSAPFKKAGNLTRFVHGSGVRGFVDSRDTIVHVLTNDSVAFLHEMVHGADFRQSHMLREDRKNPYSWKARLASKYLVEGRAKFVEKIASKRSEFTFLERIRLSTSNYIQRSFSYLFPVTLFESIRQILDTFIHTNFSSMFQVALAGVSVFVGGIMFYAVANLLATFKPYTIGLKFMEKVHEHLGNDVRRTLDITLTFRPTFEEIMKPRKYLERISFLGTSDVK